jgi:PleD family two-component response regulator
MMPTSEATKNSIKKHHAYLPQLIGGQVAKFKRNILIVDDDKEIAEVLRSILEGQTRFNVCVAHDPYEAMNLLNEKVFDMVVIDWNLPKLNALKTILEAEKLFRFDPSIPLEWDGKKVRVVTFSGDENTTCRLPSTRHFKYLGHIQKKNTLSVIIEKLSFFLNQTVDLAA